MHKILLVQQDRKHENKSVDCVWTERLETTVRMQTTVGMKTTVRLETAVRIESTVRMEMSMHIDDQDQWSDLKYN